MKACLIRHAHGRHHRTGFVATALAAMLGFAPIASLQANEFDAFLFDIGATQRISLPAVATEYYWFDDAELRVGNDRKLGRSDQSYSVRFNPIFSGQHRDEQSLMRSQLAYAESTQTHMLGESLLGRYGWLLSYVRSLQRVAHLHKRLALDSAKLGAAQELISNARFDPVDAQHAAHLLATTNRALALANARLQRTTEQMDLAIPSGDGGSLRWLITPEQIIADAYARYQPEAQYFTLAHRRAKSEWDMARAELALDHRKTHFGVKFVELGYQNERNDSAGVTVAFRLPFTRPSARFAGRLKAATAEAEFRAQRDSAKLFVAAKVMALTNDFESWKSLRSLSRDLGEQIAGTNVEAELLLALREQQLDIDAQASAEHWAMLKDYVDLLAAQGVLQERPLSNRLAGVAN